MRNKFCAKPNRVGDIYTKNRVVFFQVCERVLVYFRSVATHWHFASVHNKECSHTKFQELLRIAPISEIAHIFHKKLIIGLLKGFRNQKLVLGYHCILM